MGCGTGAARSEDDHLSPVASTRAEGVLATLTADAILDRLARVRDFPGRMTFEKSSVIQRKARGELAAEAIQGFHSISLDDDEPFSGSADVNKIVFWVAHSATDANEFFAQEVESLDVLEGAQGNAGFACSVPGASDTAPSTCLAVVDKVVLMTVAPDRPERILDDGMSLLAGLEL